MCQCTRMESVLSGGNNGRQYQSQGFVSCEAWSWESHNGLLLVFAPSSEVTWSSVGLYSRQTGVGEIFFENKVFVVSACGGEGGYGEIS